MFGWFKKRSEPLPADKKIVHQPPGEIFPWPKGWQLSALDEVIIAIPAAILSDSEVIGSIIHCDDKVRISMPTEPSSTPDMRIMLWLKVGQSAWLSKSCQAVVLPQGDLDKVPRRFKLTKVSQHAEPGAEPDP